MTENPRSFKTAWFAKAAAKAGIDDVLAKGGRYWVYQYLFAKSKRANITADELDDLRNLAKKYAVLSDVVVDRLIAGKDFTEICHAEK